MKKYNDSEKEKTEKAYRTFLKKFFFRPENTEDMYYETKLYYLNESMIDDYGFTEEELNKIYEECEPRNK